MARVWPIITTLLTVLVLGAFFSGRPGMAYSHQALAVFLFFALLWGIGSRLWWWKKGTLHGRLSRTDKDHLFQVCGRGYFWFIIGLTTLVIYPRTDDMTAHFAVIGAVWLGILGLQLIQSTTTNKGPTVFMVLSALVLTFDTVDALRPTVEPVIRIGHPFEGEWIVLQGGRSPLQSHHLSAYNQHYAVDLVKLEDGRIFKADSESFNESLWCWEAPLYSPVDGTVVIAKDDVEDSDGINTVSKSADATGNSVVIRTADDHYVLFAHLRQGSVVVSEGQTVKTGDPIGQTGNTGNTSMPHLHFQVQTHADIWDPDNRSIPFAFGEAPVSRRNDRFTGTPG